MKTKNSAGLVLLFIAMSITGLAFYTPDQCVVSGIVTDKATGEGIVSASVVLQNSAGNPIGVVTDVDGKFCMPNVPDGQYKLTVTYIGYDRYEAKSIVVKDGKCAPLKITLSASTQMLDLVVISNSKKSEYSNRSLGYSVNKVPGVTMGLGKAKMSQLYDAAPAPSAPTYTYQWSNDDIEYKTREKGGHADTVAPNQFNTEEYGRIVENEFLKPIEKPLSTFSIDVDVASYGILRRKLKERQAPPKDAIRLEEMINYFTYSYPEPKDDKPFSATTEVGECPWNANHQLVEIGIQGKKVEKSQLPPANLVFLVDVSGSMEEPDKLPLVKQSLRMLVKELRTQDRIAMVVYAGNTGLVLPSTPASDKNKIISALDRLEAGGGTNGAAGIELAYRVAKDNFIENGNNRVILCTDGDFNLGVSSDAGLISMIEKKRDEGVFLSVLGFGMGNYKDAKMEQLADKGNGNYAYIDNIDEAKKNLVTQMGGTLLTIAKDVKLQVEFNPAKVKAYRLIGYENRALADKDFNDDKKDAGEIGAGISVTALYEIITDEKDPELVAIPKIDVLKYQIPQQTNTTAQNGKELMTLKIRYKEPKENISKLLEYPIADASKKLEETSENFRFASAVASFGMLLRDSKFKGNYNYDKVAQLAKGAKGNDTEGYRAEFIKLVTAAKAL